MAEASESPRAQLRQRLLQSQQAVLAVMEQLDEAAAGAPANPGWRRRDVLAHLASAESGHCQVIRRLLAGEPTLIPGFVLDEFNNAEVEARRWRSLPELIAEYQANRADTLALLDTIADDQWAIAGPHPGGFDTTVEGVFRVITIHEKRHLRELQG
jgi:hypothetical protein